MRCFDKVFGDNNKQGAETSALARCEPCDVYLCAMLKDKLYSNNAHTEDNLKSSIQVLVSSAAPAELRRALNKVFVRCDVSL